MEDNLKKILMAIAFRDFRDEEYFVAKEIFKKAGIGVITASSQKGTAIGSQGGDTNVELSLQDINVADFDAIVFIGGQGAAKHIDDSQFHRVAQEAIKQNKILAAICIAPAILAKAGVLRGKKATVWSSVFDKSAVKILQENGAIYQSELVVQDGNIVTANGPPAVKDFGKAILLNLDRIKLASRIKVWQKR